MNAPSGRSVIHLDLDAFYASVEQAENPQYRGRPVIVGGSVRRGVVSAASYEARRFGVRSAMPMAEALRRCPDAVVLPVRMARYSEISRDVFRIYRDYTPLVEPLSLDEAFLDVSASLALFGPALEIARTIRRRVREEIGLTVSAGVAPNKFLAKIASDLEKPDGLVHVPADAVRSFLDPLPVSRIWGVGPVTARKLEQRGVRTIGQLRRLPRRELTGRFGAAGEQLYELARGIDDRPVVPWRPPKSVGNEETFEVDLEDRADLERELLRLAERVARRLRRQGLRGRTVTLKLRTARFRTVTRSRTLAGETDDGAVLFRTARDLLGSTDAAGEPVRLLGVQVSGLVDAAAPLQPGLFEDGPRRRSRLNRAVDELRDRFGEDVLRVSALLGEKSDEVTGDKGRRRCKP